MTCQYHKTWVPCSFSNLITSCRPNTLLSKATSPHCHCCENRSQVQQFICFRMMGDITTSLSPLEEKSDYAYQNRRSGATGGTNNRPNVTSSSGGWQEVQGNQSALHSQPPRSVEVLSTTQCTDLFRQGLLPPPQTLCSHAPTLSTANTLESATKHDARITTSCNVTSQSAHLHGQDDKKPCLHNIEGHCCKGPAQGAYTHDIPNHQARWAHARNSIRGYVLEGRYVTARNDNYK